MISRIILLNILACTIASVAQASVHPAIRKETGNQCPLTSVCFAIDQIGSVRPFHDQEVQFVTDVTTAFDYRALNIVFSAIGFSSNAQEIETGTTDFDDFITSIDESIPQFSGTDIEAGLKECFPLIQSQPGIRIIFLITDGMSSPDPVPFANMIKNTPDVYIFTVGIGNGVNMQVLDQIASSPEFSLKTNFADLPAELAGIVDTLCPDVVPPSCQKAFEECDFRFEGENNLPTFDVDVQQDKAFTPRIISLAEGEVLGVLNQNKIVPEFIFDDGEFAPITEFGNHKFTPTHFKPFPVANTKGSGVGHQNFQGNQLSVSKGKCIRIYFTHYQTLLADTDFVLGNMNDVPRMMKKCVVFRTAA